MFVSQYLLNISISGPFANSDSISGDLLKFDMENYTPTTGSQIERMAKRRGIVTKELKTHANQQRRKRRREAKKRRREAEKMRRVSGPVDVKEENLNLHDDDDADDDGANDSTSENLDQNQPQQDQDADEADDIDHDEHREPLVIIVESVTVMSCHFNPRFNLLIPTEGQSHETPLRDYDEESFAGNLDE